MDASVEQDQLYWLVSWDGHMHAFRREQTDPDFAVVALCRHIASRSRLREGLAQQCFGCLVTLGELLPGGENWDQR